MVMTTKLPIWFYFRCLLLLLITVATMDTPALAARSFPPSTLVFYVHRKDNPPNATLVEVASASGNLLAREFGTIYAVDDLVRETDALDSPILGSLKGLLVVELNNTFYLAGAYVLNVNGFVGTITLQAAGNLGEVVLAGGTQDFRWARGYADATLTRRTSEFTSFRVVLTIRYD